MAILRKLVSNRGSSPLARGTHTDISMQLSGKRFIPAGAGNTLQGMDNVAVNKVHPRWRGEHPTTCANGIPRGGSSPLARGTL